ncbi:hypothetical protein SNEBB_009505 [Seison nebaliae]|nr:hypothetical protein SNEBB_009505 [Seison nebaliae]
METDKKEEKKVDKIENSLDGVVGRIGKLISTECDVVSNKYEALTNMNNYGVERYSQITNDATKLNDSVGELIEKSKDISVYLNQLEDLDKTTEHIENLALKLDAYVSRLEKRVREYGKCKKDVIIHSSHTSTST